MPGFPQARLSSPPLSPLTTLASREPLSFRPKVPLPLTKRDQSGGSSSVIPETEQKRADAKPLFRNILRASPYFPIFCPDPAESVRRKLLKMHILQSTWQKKEKVCSGPNSLFRNILHASPYFPIFCPILARYRHPKSMKREILSRTSKKKWIAPRARHAKPTYTSLSFPPPHTGASFRCPHVRGCGNATHIVP